MPASYRNLVELHRCQAERLGARIALRFKRDGLYRDLSWNEYHEQSAACAAGLIAAGIMPGDRVGLLSENRLEWLIADMGIMAAGAVNVPPHAPLTAKQVHFQLADAGVRWLFLSNADQLSKLRQIRAQLPELKGAVIFDGTYADAETPLWSGFLQRGRQALKRLLPELRRREANLAPECLATIMYTSGTTGNPKGVMLTHGNLLSNACATNEASPRAFQAILLGWLPFSHIYARTVDHYLSLVAGLTLCLAESAETVVQNLDEVRPTHMSSVPRLYEKVLAAVRSDDPAETGRRLRAVFGPRIDWLGSGGAPLPLPVAQEYQKAGLLILQGYGLTESSPVISFNRKERYKLDTVGQAIPGIEVAIGPDGEVLTRGPHVMKGYWNEPCASADVIKDGWLHTGDLGRLDDEGFLSITGRKKEILVLSNGKKVVPNYLEGLLIADPCIDQAVVYGEGRNFLTALIVPNWDNVRRALSGDGDPSVSDAALAKSPAVYNLLGCRITTALREVASWEQVKKFIVLPRPFSVEAEELTVSLKMRRQVVFERYRCDLEALYAGRGPL
jgi:long-chain acyl-CoA synthetase